MASTKNTGDRVRRRLSHAAVRAAVPYLVAGSLAVVLIVLGGHEIETHIGAIEAYIEDVGAWGFLVYVALYALATSLFVPTAVMCMIAGVLFGVARGIAAVVVGSVVSSALQFFVSHTFIRSSIERALLSRPSLAAMQRAVEHDQLRLQLLLRLTPVSPALFSYILGAAGVRFSLFLLALVALVPSLAVEVYFGHAGKHAIHVLNGTTRTSGVANLAIFAGLALCLTVLIVVARSARNALIQAIHDDEETG